MIFDQESIIIHTSKGWVDLLKPDLANFNIEFFAHSLSQTNRFCGDTPLPLSVAEHSLWVAHNVGQEFSKSRAKKWYRPLAIRAALIHDASEAFTGDIPAPIKLSPSFSAFWKRFEEKLQGAIQARFEIRYHLDEEMKKAIDKFDQEAADEEMKARQSENFYAMPAKEAEDRFLKLWYKHKI